MLLCHILLYTFFEIIKELIIGNQFDVIAKNIIQCFALKSWVKVFLIGTGFMGGGEWFLVSLLEAYLVLGIVCQIKSVRLFIVKNAHIIALVLFMIHIPIRLFFIKMGVRQIGLISLMESYSVRNTWFDAIPFMLLGIFVKQNKPKSIRCEKAFAGIAIAISVIEWIVVDKIFKLDEVGIVLYFGTIIFVYIVMIGAYNTPGTDNYISKIGDKYSMLIYFIHPIIGWAFNEFFINCRINEYLLFDILFLLFVMFVSIIVSMFVFEIKKRFLKVK